MVIRAHSALRTAALLALAAAACPHLGCGGDGGGEGPLREGVEATVGCTLEPFTWQADVTGFDPGLEVEPGGVWSVDFELEVDLERYQARYGRFTEIVVAVLGELRYDEEGYYRSGSSTFALSSNLTTTGAPIERFDGWPHLRLLHGKDGSPFEGVVRFPLPGEGDLDRIHTFSGRVTAELPPDTPAGTYEPRLYVLAQVEGQQVAQHLAFYSADWNDELAPPILPMVVVGSPRTPRMPWTILAPYAYRGQVGTLPEEYAGRLELASRSGFPSDLIVPPGTYEVSPGFPSEFPQASFPPVDGGIEVIPVEMPSYLDYLEGEVSCRVSGPDGEQDLGTRRMADRGDVGPRLDGGPFRVDLSQSGSYEIRLEGWIADRYGRRFEGGGTYRVEAAHPLTFSTSCKPGTSFLVGNKYPSKVNVVPPFPATMEVAVDFWPDSDPARKRSWVVRGSANRFGHYIAYGSEPMEFDEPGEYRSEINASYTDVQGNLWRGQQVSVGVVAPEEGDLTLHGTRTFPWANRMDEPDWGAVERFADRPSGNSSFLPMTPYLFQDPYCPYHVEDTLFLSSNGAAENIVEPHVSMTVHDPVLAQRLIEAYREPTIVVPAFDQPHDGDWIYLQDVMQISTDSFAWFPGDKPGLDELPILPVGEDGWHPAVFPEKRSVQAYTTLGIVRPGFPVMTLAIQTEAPGMYWLAGPNRAGYHFNAGLNGDLPNDLYRIQAGVVLQDGETGRNHYDAYAASIAVHAADGARDSISILPPGERPLVSIAGREHALHLALDSHDTEEVGGALGLGGMVFPAVQAEARWVVTKPDGEVIEVTGTANRLGLVRGSPSVPADQPGIYRVVASVAHEDMTGDVVGTVDGTFWHCVVPADNRPLLSTTLGGMTRVDPLDGVRIPVRWPGELEDVRLYLGVIMPGQVLDQVELQPDGNGWEYPFEPLEVARQFPNFDVRHFGTGDWMMADTVVFQFFLEARRGEEPVYDSLRLALRGDQLYNYRALVSAGGHPGGSGGPPALEGAWFVRYLSDPRPYLDVAFDRAADARVEGVVADLQGPGTLYSDLELTFNPEDREWQVICDFLPQPLAAGEWWISRLQVTHDGGRQTEFVADDPRGGYRWSQAGEDGEGPTGDSEGWLGPFFVPAAGETMAHVGTHAVAGGGELDTTLAVYDAADPTRWIAFSDDPDVEDAAAKIALPVEPGRRYLVAVDSVGEPGPYGISLSLGATPADRIDVPLQTARDAADIWRWAEPLIPGEPQRHEAGDGDDPGSDRDWFSFTVPAGEGAGSP